MPLGALAALGGSHASATVPIFAGAALVFLLARAQVATDEWRVLDGALIALTAGVALQALPLPAPVIGAASPRLEALRTAMYLDGATRAATLSLNAPATRAGLASLVSALLVFWAARDVFHRGGLRRVASLLAFAGFLLVLVSLAQHATAPRVALWIWRAPDAEAMPFGPFLNRNHLATWLLMASSVTAGYLISHTRALGSHPASLRLRARDWLADGKGLLLVVGLAVMILGIAATLSRAAILGAAAALAVGFGLRRTEPRARALTIVGTAAAALLAAAVWVYKDDLARKFDATTTLSRLAIWKETIPIVRDFWTTGTGVGTYGTAMLHYQREYRDVHFNQAHSEYLQAAAEGGLLVAIPAALAAWAFLRLARRRLQHDSRAIGWIRVGAAAGLAAVAVQGIFETGLRVPANALLAALLAAIVLHRPHEA